MAKLVGILAVVSAVSGLGTVFTVNNKSLSLIRLGIKIYKRAFYHPNIKIIFQNHDDFLTLINMGQLREIIVLL